jgi:prevent-host-death family protein
MWLLKAPHIRKVVTFMPRIGLRELKIHASEVLRDVQENRARYVITKRGVPQAIMIPYEPAEEAEPVSREKAWSDFADLLRQVGDSWTSPLTADEIIRDMRR